MKTVMTKDGERFQAIGGLGTMYYFKILEISRYKENVPVIASENMIIYAFVIDKGDEKPKLIVIDQNEKWGVKFKNFPNYDKVKPPLTTHLLYFATLKGERETALILYDILDGDSFDKSDLV